MKFFAFFRKLFAVDRAYQILAEVVYDAIKRIYIPALHKLAERTKNVEQREKILAQIQEYQKYADPHTAQGQEIAEVTARVVGSTVSKYRQTVENPEDVIQQMAGDFYALEKGKKALTRFDAEMGPLKLRNYWARLLNQHSEYRFREEEKAII